MARTYVLVDDTAAGQDLSQIFCQCRLARARRAPRVEGNGGPMHLGGDMVGAYPNPMMITLSLAIARCRFYLRMEEPKAWETGRMYPVGGVRSRPDLSWSEPSPRHKHEQTEPIPARTLVSSLALYPPPIRSPVPQTSSATKLAANVQFNNHQPPQSTV